MRAVLPACFVHTHTHAWPAILPLPRAHAFAQMVLELVIRRVLELKHELVKWNPPNVDVRFPPPAPEQAFPWDYVNLDDILVDLKLSPDTLDIAVPR